MGLEENLLLLVDWVGVKGAEEEGTGVFLDSAFVA